MEAEDLEVFIDLKMNQLFHFPQWLQGPFSYGEDAWRVWVQGTLDNTFTFLKVVAFAAQFGYLLMHIIGTVVQTGRLRLQPMLWRLLLMLGTVALLYLRALWHLRQSTWATSIASGKAFRRPFPTNEEISSYQWELDPAIPFTDPTTLPDRMDVLFGSRYDAKWLGAYNRWLDYHPGNVVFRRVVSERAFLVPMLHAIREPLALQKLVDDVVKTVGAETKDGGRFLLQDHSTGYWTVMSKPKILDMTTLALISESYPVAKLINQAISFLIADYRYSHLRGTAMAVDSTIYLSQMRNALVGSYPHSPGVKSASLARPADIEGVEDESDHAAKLPRAFIIQPRKLAVMKARDDAVSARVGDGDGDKIVVGAVVMVFFGRSGLWVKGTVEGKGSHTDTYDVSFVDGSFEDDVSIRRLRRPVHLAEGVRVVSSLDGENKEAAVVAVSPSGIVELAFDDGDSYLTEVEEEEYEIMYPSF